MRMFSAACFYLSTISGVHARDIQLDAGSFTLSQLVAGLEEPWAAGALPEGGVLVTERAGRLLHIAPDGTRTSVSGVPRVDAQGQGGLLDLLIPRGFAMTRDIYLTFAKRQGRGAGTALARGTLSADGTALRDVVVLFEMAAGTSGGRHFGSRVVEGADGLLCMTLGDRGDDDLAQDLRTEAGSVIRLTRDGKVPADNPFAGQSGVRPAIFSYGHRNPQGAAVAPDGTMYIIEHGARGGDEVNVLRAGGNYGWPVISYGRHYSGARIGEGTQKDGLLQPLHYWDPSIAPSGAAVYTGPVVDWQGDLFIGSLKFDYISRLDSRSGMTEVEKIQLPETERVRDIRVGPDGSLWFLSVGRGALYALTPRP